MPHSILWKREHAEFSLIKTGTIAVGQKHRLYKIHTNIKKNTLTMLWAAEYMKKLPNCALANKALTLNNTFSHHSNKSPAQILPSA